MNEIIKIAISDVTARRLPLLPAEFYCLDRICDQSRGLVVRVSDY